MSQTVPFRVSSGGEVRIEVADDGEVRRAGTRSAGTRSLDALTEALAEPSLAQALDNVRAAADDAVRTLSAMTAQPARIELAFGIKITGEASAFIAKAGAEAQFHVTVVWERSRGDAA